MSEVQELPAEKKKGFAEISMRPAALLLNGHLEKIANHQEKMLLAKFSCWGQEGEVSDLPILFLLSFLKQRLQAEPNLCLILHKSALPFFFID